LYASSGAKSSGVQSSSPAAAAADDEDEDEAEAEEGEALVEPARRAR
jgi:hypothetical protein